MYRFKKRKKIPIKYTSRDFDSIRRDLLEIAKRDYPNIYKDFNEASFGSFMVDTVAYIGDILSFYTDYQANESFMDTAVEYNNIVKAGREKGYKFRSTPSSYGTLTLYIIVPANVTGLGPDTSYIPVIARGSEFSTNSGVGFILNEDVDFTNSNNEVVVAETDSTTGIPTSYAIKAYGQVISGEISDETIQIGTFEQFLRVPLADTDIAEIVSVVDAEGHEYFEVDNLSQNVIYKSILNRGTNRETVPAILKPVIVARRFVFEQDRGDSYLQFGYGSSEEITQASVSDPTDVVLDIHSRTYVTDEAFDPAKLMKTDKFGVAPSNSELRVVYRKNSVENVNASVNTLTDVVDPIFKFEDVTSLSDGAVQGVIGSLEVTNDESIIGDVTIPTSDELKRRIIDNYATQNRAVTKQDYLSTIYTMPPQFGAIKRANVVQDHDSFKRNLNMYVISENDDGTLVASNATLKQNLKTWINKNKMINDTVDILNAKIVNIGIEFEVVADMEENKFDILGKATAKLRELYSIHLDVGEPFNISDIYAALREVDGVLDTTKVKITQKEGGNYSDIRFSTEEYKSSDGRLIYAPENVIFEVKYPGIDIRGSVR